MSESATLYAGMGRAAAEIDPAWLPMEHFGAYTTPPVPGPCC